MSQAETAAAPKAGRRSARLLIMVALLLVLVLVLVGAGGGAFYFFFWHRPAGHGRYAARQEAPLPFYLTIKPFVVTMGGGDGGSHFVQVGATLTLAGPALGALIKAVSPEVQDAMRQTILAFKVADIMTPAGVDKLRKAMTAKVNRVLLRQLGAGRIKAIAGGGADAVRNVYFTTLIVE